MTAGFSDKIEIYRTNFTSNKQFGKGKVGSLYLLDTKNIIIEDCNFKDNFSEEENSGNKNQ